MKRFLKKALRWTAILCATIAVLLLVFYAEEDWRGARDWAACQRDLAAKGETLDLRQLVPPGNPQADLSKVPIFAQLQQENDELIKSFAFGNYGEATVVPRNRLFNFSIASPNSYGGSPKMGDYLKGEAINLAAWQNYYRSRPDANLSSEKATPAQDVLQVLSRFNSQLDDLTGPAASPAAYWPINGDAPLGHALGDSAVNFTMMLYPFTVIRFQSVACLENGQADLAEKNFLRLLNLGNAFSRECSAENYIVLVEALNLGDSILWEGLRRHAWTDAQLQEMDSALACTDTLALGRDCLRTQRARYLQNVATFQQHPIDTVLGARLPMGDLEILAPILLLRPAGWWDQDRSHYCLDIQRSIDGFDLSAGTVDRSALEFHDDIINTSMFGVYYLPLTKINLAPVLYICSTSARAETYRRLARLACRLEEYYLAHNHQYPESLADLSDLSAHVNKEVFSEQPLRYKRKGDSYSLYSVSGNLKDDGGKFSSYYNTGDWPWPNP